VRSMLAEGTPAAIAELVGSFRSALDHR